MSSKPASEVAATAAPAAAPPGQSLADFLATVEILSPLSRDEIERLAASARTLHFG